MKVAKLSAGLLLFRRRNHLEVLLVHPGGPFYRRKDAGAWSVPKGEYDEGVDPVSIAMREFTEETGMAPPVGVDALVDLGSVKQKSGKVVSVWAAEADLDVSEIQSNTFTLEWPPKSGKTEAFPEVDRAEWFDLNAAKEKLLLAQTEFIDRLASALGETVPAAEPATAEQTELF
jgi:predicted NUDIX family NTP pyrophosphohydrolase